MKLSSYKFSEQNAKWAAWLFEAANAAGEQLYLQPGVVSIFGGPGSGKSTFIRGLYDSAEAASLKPTFIGTESEYGPRGLAKFDELIKRKPKEGELIICDSAVPLTLFDYLGEIENTALQANVFSDHNVAGKKAFPEVLRASRAAGIEPKYLASLLLLDRIYGASNSLMVVVDNPLAADESSSSAAWQTALDALLTGVISLAKFSVVSTSLRTWRDEATPARYVAKIGQGAGVQNTYNIISNL